MQTDKMVTKTTDEVKEADPYKRSTQTLDLLMKIVQRDWDNAPTKVDALSHLIEVKLILDKVRKESLGQGN